MIEDPITRMLADIERDCRITVTDAILLATWGALAMGVVWWVL